MRRRGRLLVILFLVYAIFVLLEIGVVFVYCPTVK